MDVLAGASGARPSVASEAASAEGNGGNNTDKKDHGDGNLAAAANLI